MACKGVVPCRPLPGSHWVAPASANAPKTVEEVVPGALISMFLRLALAKASAAFASVVRLGVGFTVLVTGSNKSAGKFV